MHSRVNQMSQNSTQGARVLPGACDVLTCVFDCMCYFSTEHEQHVCTPCCFLGHSINTRMQVDSTCIAGRFDMHSANTCVPRVVFWDID